MKIVYFDCFSGISGDMCLGAFVDAGVPLKEIEKGLKKLKLKGYTLREQKVLRAGIAATKVDVELKKAVSGQQSALRKWKDIQKIIKDSTLPDNIKRQGLQVFKNLFEAEAKVHGSTINTTHLHELGCVDCLVDIFGTLIGLSYLSIDNVFASPVNLGSGSTRTAHGMMPVPAPATAELLKGVSCYSSGPAFEMTTPTGAVLLKTLSSGFGSMPSFSSEMIGIGAGNKDPEERPNILRIMVGETDKTVQDETITVIETNIDDMNPQVYEYVMERLFDAGALDIFLTQVIMKKSRPGVLLTALCSAEKKNDLVNIILKETTTIGIRFYEAGRVTMKREIKQSQTRFGKIRVKQSARGSSLRVTPEYEDCKRIARNTGSSLLDVMENARDSIAGKRQT
ncbi:MAG: nickel pincer cofactor biosynthesis protein LarC [Nitrospirae bacterium]|nr:nickel pincer cofactor biosynthesis protein LarC [Nitrospirota bacterium]